MTSRSRFERTTLSSKMTLSYVGAAFAYVVAALHLFHPELGIAPLVTRLSIDPALLASDPRPVGFVLSGFTILAAPIATLHGFPRRLLYALGIALMTTYIVGYFGWHFTGHGGFLPGREPLYHGLQPHEAVVTHLTGDFWAAVAILSEVVLIAILAVLYRRERGGGRRDRRRRFN